MRRRGCGALCLLLSVLSTTLWADGPAPQRFRDCADCPPMRLLAPGRFTMGSRLGERGRPEGPVHEVRLRRPFALAETEVTVRQFGAFVEATGHVPAPGCRVYLDGRWQNSQRHGWRDPGPGIAYGPAYPVVCVSWEDAVAYAGWLSRATGRAYRLPSEAEWEYAALAGSAGPYAWGAEDGIACRHANVYDRTARGFAFSWPTAPCDDGYASLAPVASFEANAFGLHDMHGNVWEWVADCYLAPYPRREDAQTALEPAGACERRSVRGGSWMTRLSRQRAAFRGRDPASARMAYFGFRVAAEHDGD